MAALRADFVFSYWIYVWYILYRFHWTKESPKFALLLGLLYNVLMLILMIYYGSSYTTIFMFLVINTVIKIIPLIYLREETIQGKDWLATLVLFGVFVGWLHLHKQNLVGNSKLIHDSLLQNKHATPFMNLLTKIGNHFKHLQLF
jgi:drug/metabolite transporter (DMT)-like permease